MRLTAITIAAFIVVPLGAQVRRPVRKPAPPAPAALKQAAPAMICQTPLGVGVESKLNFCDVLTGRDPAQGILITLPPHKGPVTLTFDLHNRQTYSEEQVQAHRAYARYTATIGVFAMDNTLISRAVVRNEFRTAGDLVDRIAGGAGPGGVKAVAPTGTEPVSITIPESESEVSVLGEKLTVDRADGTATYSSVGRPIAVLSHVMIEYRPGPPPKPVKKKVR
ncbi:MAG TPA: hypothetical protein VHU82_04260 [Vicinamibacterales bacterium]|jgi:hypothetical protein|nr:hypothetical protein [Vicinamibacterales bacterium]